jgi:hypothetical protein
VDRFRVRPFKSFLQSSLVRVLTPVIHNIALVTILTYNQSPGSVFHALTAPFSKSILDTLPENLLAELQKLVGEKPELDEPQLQTLRRIQLRPEIWGKKAVQDPDPNEGKWSLDTVGHPWSLPASSGVYPRNCLSG